MSNPNPVRRRQTDVMSDRMKAKFSLYVPRKRHPGEATSITSTVMNKTNVYKPVAWVAPVR